MSFKAVQRTGELSDPELKLLIEAKEKGETEERQEAVLSRKFVNEYGRHIKIQAIRNAPAEQETTGTVIIRIDGPASRSEWTITPQEFTVLRCITNALASLYPDS